jgi:transcriptional regulator with XRE-family HTH domain
MVNFGAVLVKLRKRKSLTQEELAYRCGMDRSYIGKLENNKYSPALNTMLRIAYALEIEQSEFFKEIADNLNLPPEFFRNCHLD